MKVNVEAYNLDSLRKLVRDLQAENRELRSRIRELEGSINRDTMPEMSSGVSSEASSEPDDFDPDQGARILPIRIDEETANRFLSRFWGRLDVYAKRGAKGGYYPQCRNRWESCCPKKENPKKLCDEDCPYKKWKPLQVEQVMRHLRGYKADGSDAIGVYPLFPDQTCRFLVFDFDNHAKGAEAADFANQDDAWMNEVDALRRICRLNQIPALTERSRSGRGAHVWIFFNKPVSAIMARNFGFALLDRGSAMINLTSFRFYDRMYPSQDAAKGLGNLIALPLQGGPVRDGNSVFVDESWNAYPDQMEVLESVPRIGIDQIQHFLETWSLEQTGQMVITGSLNQKERLKPWKKDNRFAAADVTGVLHLVLADGLYVDALNLQPRLQNQIRCMATIDNPEYYKNLHSKRSNYYNFSTIYLGRDTQGYIRIPRGLKERIISKCTEAGIPYDIEDRRETGRPIRVTFKGTLREQQVQAAASMLAYDHGVLSSATGSGKTVICSYLIAARKVNTLILVSGTDLVDQWISELERFLAIDEPLPQYRTPGGKTKTRERHIGTLGAGQDKTGGLIDIAMVGSAFKKGSFFERIDSYGMVIMDECHHAASPQAQAVLQRIHSKYVYGVSATPVRSDQLEKINYMLIGPIRHEYSAKAQAMAQGIGLYMYPRFTRVVDLHGKVSADDHQAADYHAAMDLICGNQDRNAQILRDVRTCIEQGRTPVILTGRKQHARELYAQLEGAAGRIFLMYGDNTQKENDQVRREMDNVSADETMILIATGQKIGEGFNFPRLDTLFLSTPVKFDGRLTQYAGRLSRPYPGKKDVIVYDYVDIHIPIFDRQYRSRLRAYKKLGYQVLSGNIEDKQQAQVIYDQGNYTEVFERDLVQADQDIIIASPGLTPSKVRRMLQLVRPRQEAGVRITVITTDPDQSRFGDGMVTRQIIREMEASGIRVRLTDRETEHFAVFDGKLIWHGGMNLLGREDAWDNLIRLESVQAAAELMEMAEELQG